MLKQYLVKNGTLLSILNGEEKKSDILVTDGVVTEIAEHIEAPEADVIDAEGMYVTTGWLDSHTHFANWGGDPVGISPVEDLLRQRASYFRQYASEKPLLPYMHSELKVVGATPIIAAGDGVGVVALLGDGDEILNDTQKKLLVLTSTLLANHLEI